MDPWNTIMFQQNCLLTYEYFINPPELTSRGPVLLHHATLRGHLILTSECKKKYYAITSGKI